jgi:class 3 adenylate cyclase/predicted ATPase
LHVWISLVAYLALPMGDVAAWLQGLGLSRYVRTFEENEIEFETLPLLTEGMLEQMGLPIGPRAKLLAAISELALSPRAGELAAAETAAPREQAERRQITVMFCDLVDSTKLAGALDPEDLRSVFQAYQRGCRAIIERYEGHVARTFGDGILTYFGWPTAREDAAERAVRAGLEIVEAVRALTGPEPLSVRVGINTGIVVISEADLAHPSAPSDAFGETLHVAARLETLAPANSVLIAESTNRLVSGRFDQEGLGPQTLKGVIEPVHVFRVKGVRPTASRFQASIAEALTPFVGRRAELAFLQECWRRAWDGEGQIVFVSGVPGIGKSRIVYELQKLIEGEPRFSLSFQCLPHCTESALFPIIQEIDRLGELTSADTDDVKLDKIERLLSLATGQPDKAMPFVAEMLSIPIEPRYAALAMTGAQVKNQTLFVLVDLLLGLATNGPVLCVLEDAQWIDPSTQELLDLVVSQIQEARILLVVTHRPEYQVHPTVHGNVGGLAISRLGRREVAEMAQLALRHQSVSSAVVNRIIGESDSIPLFVEELARGVVGPDGIDANGLANRHTAPSASWLVPDSLRDSLVARLDRAPQARNVAQIAAVLGREFSYEMLLRVSSLSGPGLDAALAHLRDSEIVQLIGTRPSPRYAFKHALVRDAAYESLLKSSRRQVHSKVGSIIEQEWPEIVASQPELLAYHYSLAGNAELAMRYWLSGGRRARDRSAIVEAVGQLQKALECLMSLPETPGRRETELEIQLSLGLGFIAVRGYSARDTRKSFERARHLSAVLGEPGKELQAIFGVWGHYWMRARHDRALGLAETLLAKAAVLDDPTALIVGHRSLGSTLFTFGDFIRARDHLSRAVALGELASTSKSFLSYAVDPRIAARLMLAWVLWILGYPGQALDEALRALAQANEQNDPYSIAFAHYVTSAVTWLRGEPEDSLRHADQSLAISREHRINLYALYSRFGRGCALAMMGQEALAMFEIREGIEEASRSKLGYLRAFMLGGLASLQAETEDPETALSTIDRAVAEINDVAGRAWEAEIHRLRGSILLAARADAVDAAERSFTHAIAIAKRQNARSWELRATTSLARLLQGQNRNKEARKRLGDICGWFTEGFDTIDLKTAKALLDELAPADAARCGPAAVH